MVSEVYSQILQPSNHLLPITIAQLGSQASVLPAGESAIHSQRLDRNVYVMDGMATVQHLLDHNRLRNLSLCDDFRNAFPYPSCAVTYERKALGFRNSHSMQMHGYYQRNTIWAIKRTVDRAARFLIQIAFVIMYKNSISFGSRQL